MQEITRRFSRYSVGCCFSYLAFKVFSGPSFGDVANQSTFLNLSTADWTDKATKQNEMKKILFICLLIIASASTAKAQWGYNPYSAQLQMMTAQQMQQAAQAVQQMQQQMFSQPFIYTPTPNTDACTNVAPPSAPTYNNQPTEYNHNERKRDYLNRVVGEYCTSCHGSGKCKACNGTKVAHGMGLTYACNVCDANGNCSVCHGTGKTSWNR